MLTKTNDDCKLAREAIEIAFRKDMLGPGSERMCGFPDENEVICENNVKTRYTVGILYPPVFKTPQDAPSIDENIPSELGNDDEETVEVSDNDETQRGEDRFYSDSEDDGEDLSRLAHEFTPSAMGISFRVAPGLPLENVTINASAASYCQVIQFAKQHSLQDVCCVELLCPKDFVTKEYCDFLTKNHIELVDGAVKGRPGEWLLYFSQLPVIDENTGVESTPSIQQSCDEFAKERCSSLAQNSEFMAKFREVISSNAVPSAVVNFFVCQNWTARWKRKFPGEEIPAEILFLEKLGNFLACVKKLYRQYYHGLKRIGISWQGSLKDLLDGNEAQWRCDNQIAEIVKSLKISAEKRGDLCSVFISNQCTGKDYFAQPRIEIAVGTPDILALQGRSVPDTLEEQMIQMRYRNVKQFAKGHGCSAQWENSDNDSDGVRRIWTNYLPRQCINSMDWEVRPENDEIAMEVLKKSLNWEFLANSDSGIKDDKIGALRAFVDNYGFWTDKQEEQKTNDASLTPYAAPADETIRQCRNASARMRDGVNLLEHDDVVYRAFCLAHEAMLRSVFRDKPLDEVSEKDRRKWRLFQLGFVLLSLESLVKPDSGYRNTVDLLWFPTGGGKTEAYLLLTALTIFYRHLSGNGDKRKIGGTAVIMRYTLRLLTSQQFNRAAALICACDRIRQEKSISNVPITLGLWVGSQGGEGIPNRVADAYARINELNGDLKKKNPFQPTHCPWCKGQLDQVNHAAGPRPMGFRADKRQKTFEIFCLTEGCHYHDVENLPIQIIDECLYENPPTLLFGTVDKFAQLALNEKTGIFFGLKDGQRCSPPPGLIIQDELHLITDALGTMVGLYETAIKGLCLLCDGVNPKIIASTATVRRADEQCKSLYGCEGICQFPPSGLNADDSYFARENKVVPGREYVALQSAGQTASTTVIRAMASLLFRINNMPDWSNDLKDLYYTLVTYFNSLRELGACETWIPADITQRIEYLAKYNYQPPRSVRIVDSLCSRRDAAEIPGILAKLEKNTYSGDPNKPPVDVLLASNMLSVGIDIDRFGMMLIDGHPKKNAEFIQASSRVGRQLPSSGLVFCLYNGAKARDCSYFEVFPDYIQSFYKYVEPTTVTPFTKAARDRALHAVIVILMRHTIPECQRNTALQDIANRLTEDKFDGIKELVMNKVQSVCNEIESNAIAGELTTMIRCICQQVTGGIVTHYFDYGRYQNGALLCDEKSDLPQKPPFRTMQSVRNVDKTVTVKVTGEE